MAPSASPGRLVERASGTVIALPAKDDLTVGRPDEAAGTVPDIDLGPVNQNRTVSRRHARIQRRNGRLFVVEEAGVANGTWLNGERLAPGTPVEVSPGDEVGFGGVRLVFHDA